MLQILINVLALALQLYAVSLGYRLARRLILNDHFFPQKSEGKNMATAEPSNPWICADRVAACRGLESKTLVSVTGTPARKLAATFRSSRSVPFIRRFLRS